MTRSLGVCMMAILSSAACAQTATKTCFTITVVTKMQSSGGGSEEHKFQGTYRAARVGDIGIYSTLGNQESCNVAAMEPGLTHRFFLTDLRGTANGRSGKESATTRIDGLTAQDKDAYVTITRKEKGATLEFTANSPLPSSESCDHCINMCAAQNFDPWPNKFELSEEDLTRPGSVTKTLSLSLRPGENDCTGSGTATLNATLATPEEEMVFEPATAYNGWIPAPLPDRMPGITISPAAATLRVTVKIQSKKPGVEARRGRMDFTLEQVTRHKGRCGNYPRNGQEKDDLRFAEEQPEGIVLDGPTSAHTAEEESEATVVIEALDTAAWGRLTARSSTLDLKAIYKATNTYSLTIPRDDDEDKIADAWQRQMSLPAQPNLNADQDRNPSQQRAGDGLTVLDEYRGLVVLDQNGSKVLRRLNPFVKDLFIVDPEAIFDTDLWSQISSTKAHKVDESMIAGGGGTESSRVVNINTDDSSHFEYAVRVKTMSPAEDPDGEHMPDPRQGLTPCGQCKSPKDADYAAIVPDRARRKVDRLYQDLIVAVSDPNSPQAQLLADDGIPVAQARAALERLHNPATRDALARQMKTHLIMHEVGHACGLMDHRTSPPTGMETVVRSCPMYNPGNHAYMRFIVNQVLSGMNAAMSMQYKEFCRGMESYASGPEGYNCIGRLNVADW